MEMIIGMIKLFNLKAKNLYHKNCTHISFGVENTDEDLSQYTFNLLRSDSPEGEFYEVYSNIIDFECDDTFVELSNPEIHYFYRIKCINNELKEVFVSDTFYESGFSKDDYFTFYINNVYEQYLDILDNDHLLLLKKIRSGQRCGCYDDVRGSSRSGSTCKICFGTSFVHGYFRPIKLKCCFINTETKQEGMNENGSTEETTPLAFWTVGFPEIQENDIIINTYTNKRYAVMTCTPSLYKGYVIRQVVQMLKIPETNIEYSIPVDM